MLRIPFLAALLLAFLLATACTEPPPQDSNRADDGPVAADELLTGFANPPAAARPRVWWHWMNGNVTKDGITKDLEWMQRVGIGGLQSFDATLRTPQIVENRLVYMTPEWKDAFQLAASKADELGLELTIAASPGWSETGGPWVPPEDGMKKLVWSEIVVQGGEPFADSLPQPPSASGQFHDLVRDGSVLAAFTGEDPYVPPTWYQDVAVFAYPIPHAAALPVPGSMTSGEDVVDSAALTDGSLETFVALERGTADRPLELTLEYQEPVTVRSASLFVREASGAFGAPAALPYLEAYEEGAGWRRIADIALSIVPTTVSFTPVTARRFRIVFAPGEGPGLTNVWPAPGAEAGFLAALFAPSPHLEIAEIQLNGEPRVHRYETKAGFDVVPDYYALDAQSPADGAGVPPDAVIDLTARLGNDGSLEWTPPEGSWRIVRLGWSLTGKANHPAPPEATGLEVDKYDSRAVREYLEHYIGMYKEAAGAGLLGERGVQALLTDSIEVGPSNWTPGLAGHFQRLRGYDPGPWLPALTGAIIGSRKETDAFLFDFRQTLSDLITEAHYRTVAEVAHEYSLKVYGESHEGGRNTLGDDLDMRRFADFPMAALWTYPRGQQPQQSYLVDMKGAASVANVYGQNVAAAESMTSALQPWAHAPADLRRVIDLEFAYGINRPVIHTSVHQPLDDKQPGLSLMIFGQFFNRHETWAEMARPWIDYMARNAYMLQQGRHVADVAYFYGEEAPVGVQAKDHYLPDVPSTHGYDFVSAHALSEVLNVVDGDLVAPSGARYKALFLGGTSEQMTLPTLRRLAELVDEGATVIGQAPSGSPGLIDDPNEYASVVEKLWSGQAATSHGKGQVIAESDVEAALARLGVGPDFSFVSSYDDSEVLFVHRRHGDTDIYFVNNRSDREESIDARFRVSGRLPEIWRADTGGVERVSFHADGDTTVVPLDMQAEDSFFVVFRTPTEAKSGVIEKPVYEAIDELSGPWSVAFQEGRGAPVTIGLEELRSLSVHDDPGVKYFSGVATYSTRFNLREAHTPGNSLILDLGQVGDLAEVEVNGMSVGTVWHAPWRLDIGQAVTQGENQLRIKVANLWVNRLIGDTQPGAEKVAFTTIPTYQATAPLRPSGLIGPARLLVDAGGQRAR